MQDAEERPVPSHDTGLVAYIGPGMTGTVAVRHDWAALACKLVAATLVSHITAFVSLASSSSGRFWAF